MRGANGGKWVVILATVALVITAGCTNESYPEPKAGFGTIDIDGDRSVNETGFFMDGTIYFDLNIDESTQFKSVMLCAYDQGGNVLAEDELGNFTAPSDKSPFSIHSDNPPMYITVDHPQFREFESLGTETFVRINNGTDPSYRHESDYLEDIQDDFLYPRNDMMGQCG